ncbi:MAG: NAD(P)/FAD-dependent oxidoreductase [Ferruginibacter sp.]|nr:NAD(P)/FAD-dependent oxidoreductase [Ferruginibacter sp.]
MNNEKIYDTALVGGGLAGLCLSIQLAKQGHKVILFEKETYPFHKVCGEYISMESWDFLCSLGLPLLAMNLPMIRNLEVSSPAGKLFRQPLPLGGFGISRFLLDNALKNIALEAGVEIKEGTKVEDVVFNEDHFELQVKQQMIIARTCAGTFGKRSNLDVKWKRSFLQRNSSKLDNFIAVKYHIRLAFPLDTIALHNFEDGYCGLSKIEADRYCLCYLTNAANLKKSHNSIEEMEQQILAKNPFLKIVLNKANRLYDSPLTISQVSFQKKSQVDNHLLMLGDAAGLITPLCGNGMSMAMHSSKIAAGQLNTFLQGQISRQELEENYQLEWKKNFAGRLRTGRIIQSFFGKAWKTEIFISVMKLFPAIARQLIRQTHGKPF